MIQYVQVNQVVGCKKVYKKVIATINGCNIITGEPVNGVVINDAPSTLPATGNRKTWTLFMSSPQSQKAIYN